MPGIAEGITKLFGAKPEKYNEKSMPGVSGRKSRVDWIDNEFVKVRSYHQDTRDREEDAWKLYSGYSNGQWDAAAVSKLQEEGRHIGQFNLIRGKIDGLAGSIIKNWYDIDFIPVDGAQTDWTLLLKKMMYSDKELLDWDQSYIQAVLDGLVFRGVEQMVINDRYSPLGNIGFEHIMPGHILFDPGWVSNNGWDLKKAWKVAYLTVDEIKNKYKHMSEDIEIQLKIRQRLGEDYLNGNENGEGFPHTELSETYGTRYRVIEYHHVEEEKTNVEMVVSDGTVIPDYLKSDEEKKDWALMNSIDLTDGVVEIPRNVNVYYVSTICPELDRMNLLEDCRSEIQIGRLPFFSWSVGRINGVDGGIVDLLKDAQQTINKRESLIDHMVAASANGAIAMDPEMIGNDEAKKADIIKNINNPSYKFWTEPGFLASGRNGMSQVPRIGMDSNAISEIMRMYDVIDRISKQTPSLDGRNESSHETGVLFARKQLQSEVALTTMTKGLEQYWNEKGEAYMLLAKSHYSGVYREFKMGAKDLNSEGRGQSYEVIKINEKVNTPEGKVTLNDISTMPRHKVIVSQSPQGITQRATDRAMYAELIRVVPPENAGSRSHLFKKLMQTIDLSTKDKEELEAIYGLETELATEQLRTNILGLKMQQQQIQMQAQMGQQQQMAAMMGALQGGGPEGAPQPAPEDMMMQ